MQEDVNINQQTLSPVKLIKNDTYRSAIGQNSAQS